MWVVVMQKDAITLDCIEGSSFPDRSDTADCNSICMCIEHNSILINAVNDQITAS